MLNLDGLPSDLPSSGGGSCGRRCLRSTLCAGEFRLRPCARVPAPLRDRGGRAASAISSLTDADW